ncbi:hypothetical protein ACFVZD_37065 [Streptomyces sp. NPDC058287]|uniref:hypothetical protein n=1 Tax=Streptomyces sp. NPDC058287 TaxID=3346423 RepID=UPI0036F0DC01
MTNDQVTKPDLDQQAAAVVLPGLISLDEQATALERAARRGDQITQSAVASYELSAEHARHLIKANGLSKDNIAQAAREQGGASARSTVLNGLDHANRARIFEPTPEHESDIDL